MATREKVEATVAVNAVAEADKKVEQIKADKLAAEAAKDAETLAKHPKIGSKLNWLRHNKWRIAGAAATGGASFVVGWFANKIYTDHKAKQAAIADASEVDDSEVVEEATEE